MNGNGSKVYAVDDDSVAATDGGNSKKYTSENENLLPGREFLTRTHSALYYMPVYKEKVETTYMRLFHKFINQSCKLRRILSSIWLQNYYTPTADFLPHLKGKFVLLTGGTEGIGFEIALGLVLRGAYVMITSSKTKRAALAVDAITALCKLKPQKIDFIISHIGSEGPAGILSAIKHLEDTDLYHSSHKDCPYGEIHSLFMDITDIKSIEDAIEALGIHLPKTNFSHVILCASVFPAENLKSIYGHEMTFTGNVLANFIIIQLMIRNHMVKFESQILFLGCEDYFYSTNCVGEVLHADRDFNDTLRHNIYNESKLGLFWLAFEIQKRYEFLNVCVVHPGYVDTERGRDHMYHHIGNFNLMFFISARSASQTVIICAQYSKLLPKGAYYHNTLGFVTLDPRETAMDELKATSQWDYLQQVFDRYYNASHPGRES